MSQDNYLSVTQINREIKKQILSNKDFKMVFVKGELTDVSLSKGGHYYFSLKDDKSKINCVAFYRVRKRLKFKLKDGMQVLIIGQIGVYLEKGEYEIIVNSITEDGLGQLYVALEQLKNKLSKEGLFDDEFKKPLPSIPKKIGVVTAFGGAAIKDIIKTIKRKSYNCQIYIFPSLVQGSSSVEEITRKINMADNYNLDCLIVGRGGGSAEDLWSFNSESVVRAVFNCQTPVISAVGHQKDSTLIDYVSDVRAHTPTDAANIIINQFLNSETKLLEFNSRLLTLSKSQYNDSKNKLDVILSKSLFKNATLIYESQRSDFEKLYDKFNASSEMLMADKRNSLSKIKQEYVIRHPCKMQLESSISNLNELETRLIDVMDKILNETKVNLDKTINKFNVSSQKIITSKKHELEMSKYYFISNPCQKHVQSSKNSLKLTKEKLISSVNINLENSQRDFVLIYNNFNNNSKDFINSNRIELDQIKNGYVIRHPCKIQVDKSNNNLNEFQTRLMDVIDKILNETKVDLDRTSDKFDVLSKNLVTAKKHDFEMVKSNFSPNLYQNQLDTSRSGLNLKKERLIGNIHVNIDNKRKDLLLIKNDFKNQSKQIFLENSHNLDVIKNLRIIKNPQLVYEFKYNELNNLKNKKVIKNPNLILNSYKSELKIYKEKLDKIEQVIELKKQQEKQKQRYLIVIVAVVIVMIILFIIFGGIL